MKARPRIFGIVNITPDSFSDGGAFLAPDNAIAHGQALLDVGADTLDLGPASSHPDAAPVPPEEEIRRLAPVLRALKQRGASLSVDSFQPETQRFALAEGVDFLNDIEGFARPEMHPELAASQCRLVVMHSVQRRGPATRVRTDAAALVDGILEFFHHRLATLEAAGVARERLVVDPGMGFFLGQGPEPSLAVLQCLPEIKQALGRPLLVSVSRKSFLGTLTGRPAAARGAATLAAELFAAAQGADYLRTHDASALRDALLVQQHLGGAFPLKNGS